MGHTFICNQFSCGIWKFVGLKKYKNKKTFKNKYSSTKQKIC